MNIKRVNLLALFVLMTGILFIYCGDANIHSQTIHDVYGQKLEIVQPGNEAMAVSGGLFIAGHVLAQMYLKPVTFEGPTDVLQWDGDVDQEVLSNGTILRIPKRGTFVIPDGVRPDKNRQLDSSVLEKVVGEYQKQFSGPKYKIISSKLGLHLITDEVRDKNGQWVKEKPYLDVVISIPSGKRTGLGHLRKIVDAVNVSKELKLWINTRGDYNLFWNIDDIQKAQAINKALFGGSLTPDNSLLSENDRLLYEEELSFEWGADKIGAREALINLLEKANTTLIWRVDCTDHPDVNQKCFIEIMPIVANYLLPNGETWKTYLTFDRITTDK